MARGKKAVVTLTPEEKLQQALVPVEEQPYEIPENWCWVYLSSICDLKSGSTLPEKNEKQVGEMIYIKVADMNLVGNEKYIVYSSRYVDDYNTANIIPADSVIFPKRGGAILTNKKRITSVPILADLNIMAVTPKIMVDLVYDWFLTVDLGTLNNGSNVPQINNKDIAPLLFPLPPLTEQQRIVERIESIFTKLDEAKEKAQVVVDGFELRKSAILHKAFTGELTAQWRQEHGVGLDSWENLLLKDCTSSIGDGLHGTPNYDDNGNYYFVNGNNFEGKDIEIKPDTKRVNEIEFEKHKVNLQEDMTVFVSINGTLGKTAFYNNEPIILGKSACYVNVLPSLDRHFLRFFFESKEFIDYANEMATGSTIKNLGLKAMRSMPIHLPTLDEQMVIVQLLEEITEKEQQAKDSAEAVINQIDAMKKAVLARAFRGELGTNDPTEESAVELLKSVL